MKNWSLRGRLFVLIMLPLIGVAAMAAGARYVLAERMSQRLYDSTLLVVALTISRDVVLSEGDILAEQLLESLTTALGDPVYYRITGPEGRFVTGYSDPPPLPAEAAVEPGVPYFYNATALGAPVRAVTLREFISEPQFGGWVTVEVWQTVNQRNALSLELLAQAAILMVVVLLAAGLLLWFSINTGLRPLLDLRAAVTRRSPDDLSPIGRPVPREVRSLVGAMNGLFERLADAFARRDAFISDAAHQLRNPIAAIQSQAEAATTAPTEARLRARVAELADLSRRTGRLTNQLLSMEKVSGRKQREHRQDVDLAALVRDAAGRFAEATLHDGINVSFATSGQVRTLMADPVMLREAVENLLDNARRYGCPGGGDIEVSVDFARDGVSVTVSDSGPGIPPGARARVFDRFYRAADDQSGGCGLGLAIVQEVARSHGGTAAVVRDAKSAIRMTLPLGP